MLLLTMPERLKRKNKWDKPAEWKPTEDDVDDAAIREAVVKAVIDALRPTMAVNRNRTIISLGRQEIEVIAASASAAFVKESWARASKGTQELNDPLPDFLL